MKNPTESEIQQAVMKWWAMAHRRLGVPHERLLMAFPMQGLRSPKNGARMKAEGMRAGLSDMFLATPRTCPKAGVFYCGLWIELKRPKPRGVVSEEQAGFLSEVNMQGYSAKVCYGFDECVKAITDYLNTKP